MRLGHLDATPLQIGVNVVTRLMGLLLVAVGVEFIARGVSALFPTLSGP